MSGSRSAAAGDPAPDDLFERIARNRVGGTFWGSHPSLPDGAFTLACARDADDARQMVEPGNTARMVVHLPRLTALPGHIVLSGEVDPWPILERAVEIHVHGDDEWAALAQIAGRRVTFHSPGRYDDPAKVRQELLAGGYRNPFTASPTTIDAAIQQLTDWRELIDANRPISAASGMAWWKRREVKAFLWAPRPRPLLITRLPSRALDRAKRTGGAIAIWPSRTPARLEADAASNGLPVVRMEDGFIRSVGLGSNLFPPLSVAVDSRGIYYDPSRPSDLEHLLQTAEFDEQLLKRARALQQHLIAAGISKYGTGEGSFPSRAAEKRLILVPGQVEDDESVRLGGGGLAGNLDLLRRTRALEPESEIWFRPHPDVDAGHRKGRVADADALRFADRVVRGGSMARLLDMVDGLHVLSSLAGFEGLIRGREVAVHGVPFYAGWGLTRDLAPTPARRTRRLHVLELTAATLILYPRYLDPVTRLPCPVETLVARLESQSRPAPSWVSRIRQLQGKLIGKTPRF